MVLRGIKEVLFLYYTWIRFVEKYM
jgi:hypothetical protein